MAAYDDVLDKLGFTANGGKATELQQDANDPTSGDGDLSHNGEYKVLRAWTKGDTVVHLEQNTAPDDIGDGMTAVITHPPVLIVEKGGVRAAAVSPRDPEALEAVLTEVG